MKNLLATLLLVSTFLACKTTMQQYAYETILWTADWSPNGKWIATGGNHNELRILSGSQFQNIEKVPAQHTITKIKWHPDNQRLAIALQSSETRCQIFNIATKKSIFLDSISEAGARALDWNYDGTMLAVGDNDGAVVLYSDQGVFLKKIKVDPKSITGLSWHPHSNELVTVGSGIGRYNLEKDHTEWKKARTEDILLLCVAWHPSGSFFVTGDYGDFEKNYPPLLQFWAASGENIRDITASKAEYRSLAWASDGNTLATASDGIRLWNSTGKLLRHRLSEKYLWGIDWNTNDDRLIVTSGRGETIRVNKSLKTLTKY